MVSAVSSFLSIPRRCHGVPSYNILALRAPVLKRQNEEERMLENGNELVVGKAKLQAEKTQLATEKAALAAEKAQLAAEKAALQADKARSEGELDSMTKDRDELKNALTAAKEYAEKQEANTRSQQKMVGDIRDEMIYLRGQIEGRRQACREAEEGRERERDRERDRERERERGGTGRGIWYGQ